MAAVAEVVKAFADGEKLRREAQERAQKALVKSQKRAKGLFIAALKAAAIDSAKEGYLGLILAGKLARGKYREPTEPDWTTSDTATEVWLDSVMDQPRVKLDEDGNEVLNEDGNKIMVEPKFPSYLSKAFLWTESKAWFSSDRTAVMKPGIGVLDVVKDIETILGFRVVPAVVTQHGHIDITFMESVKVDITLHTFKVSWESLVKQTPIADREIPSVTMAPNEDEDSDGLLLSELRQRVCVPDDKTE